MSELRVEIDDRLRLVAAVLAASDWPALEQVRQGTHAVHAQAKATAQFLSPFREHEAVVVAGDLLRAGYLPSLLFTTAAHCRWPDFEPRAPLPAPLEGSSWPAQLADFCRETRLATHFWPQHRPVWEKALQELRELFAAHDLKAFLQRLLPRPLSRSLVMMPNLTYPALEMVVAEGLRAWKVLIPPPRAVGESPPWPYRDEPEWVLIHTLFPLLPYLLPLESLKLPLQAQHALTAALLEELLDETAALFYLKQCMHDEELEGLFSAWEAAQRYLRAAEGRRLTDYFV